MTELALCQCVKCRRYLKRNRAADGSDPQVCVKCHPHNDGTDDVGIPLADIRGTLQDKLSIELVALLAEEAGEVAQRCGKIFRWAWDADFDGTSQAYKLEVELGDIVANTVLAAYNGKISLDAVLKHAEAKMEKYREDARGPRQRLLHAEAPDKSVTLLVAAAIGRILVPGN